MVEQQFVWPFKHHIKSNPIRKIFLPMRKALPTKSHKKKLIAVFLNDANPYGANLSVVDLIQAHIKNDSNFIFNVFLPLDGPICENLNSAGIQYAVIKYKSIAIPRGTGWLNLTENLLKTWFAEIVNWAAVQKLRYVFKKNPPSIIHSNTSTVAIGFLLSQSLKIPHIAFVREDILGDNHLVNTYSISKQIKRLEKVDLCVFSSCFLRDRYNLSNKSEVIYDLVDVEENDGKVQKSNYFFVSASLDCNKSIDTTILAHAEIVRQGYSCELWIAGDGDFKYKRFLQQIANQNGTEKNVKFLGYIKNVGPLIARATAVIVSSKIEGFGRVTAEALMRSTLVIGRNTSGTRELLSGGINGLLFDTGEGLTEAMKTALTEKEKCACLIESGRIFAISKLNKRRFLDATKRVYAAVSYNQ